MPKSNSKRSESTSRNELRRQKEFQKRKISWPLVAFGLFLIGALAAAGMWQRSRQERRLAESKRAPVAKADQQEINTLDELNALAEEIEQKLVDPSATYVGRVASLDRLAAACRSLAERTKEPDQIAIYRSKELLSRYFKLVTFAERELDDTAERSRVLALISGLEASGNPDIRYQVSLAKLVLPGTTLVLSPESQADFEAFSDALKSAVTAYPSDTRLAALSQRFIVALKNQKRFPSDRFSELAKTLIAAYSETENLAIQVWTRELSDELLFEQYRYRDLLIKCEMDTPSAFENYLTTLPKILEGKPTPLGFARLLSAGNSFERVNRTKEAAEVYRLIDESIPALAADELAEVKRGCESGRNRLSLIGKRFNFDGVDLDHRKLELSEILGEPVIVGFLNAADPDFEAQILRLQAEMRPSVKRGLRLIIVALNIEAEVLAKQFRKAELEKVWVVADPERSSLMWNQCKAEVLPLVVMIDSAGVVQRFANFDIHLFTMVEGELNKVRN